MMSPRGDAYSRYSIGSRTDPCGTPKRDNDNNNSASGILSEDVFVQLHFHSSSEVLPEYSSKVSLLPVL